MPPIRPIRIGGMLYIFRYDEGREAYRQNVRSSAYSLSVSLSQEYARPFPPLLHLTVSE